MSLSSFMSSFSVSGVFNVEAYNTTCRLGKEYNSVEVVFCVSVWMKIFPGILLRSLFWKGSNPVWIGPWVNTFCGLKWSHPWDFLLNISFCSKTKNNKLGFSCLSYLFYQNTDQSGLLPMPATVIVTRLWKQPSTDDSCNMVFDMYKEH